MCETHQIFALVTPLHLCPYKTNITVVFRIKTYYKIHSTIQSVFLISKKSKFKFISRTTSQCGNWHLRCLQIPCKIKQTFRRNDQSASCINSWSNTLSIEDMPTHSLRVSSQMGLRVCFFMVVCNTCPLAESRTTAFWGLLDDPPPWDSLCSQRIDSRQYGSLNPVVKYLDTCRGCLDSSYENPLCSKRYGCVFMFIILFWKMINSW